MKLSPAAEETEDCVQIRFIVLNLVFYENRLCKLVSKAVCHKVTFVVEMIDL